MKHNDNDNDKKQSNRCPPNSFRTLPLEKKKKKKKMWFADINLPALNWFF